MRGAGGVGLAFSGGRELLCVLPDHTENFQICTHKVSMLILFVKERRPFSKCYCMYDFLIIFHMRYQS